MAPSRQRSFDGIQSQSSGASVHTTQNRMSGNECEENVAIIGGGLVGSMASCFLAKRGYQVDLFEMRKDPRRCAHVVGKSINMALSERGRAALRKLGLEDLILEKYSIKMRARMIHNLDGSLHSIPYGTEDQYILSVSRRFLNELLITEAEKYPNVKIHFDSKLIGANLVKGQLEIEKKSIDSEESETLDIQADVIIGADGAHSAIRRHMIKLLLLDYSQKYIEHGYIELCIQPTASGDFAIAPNYLHIWPRGSFMMIALPNLDRSFTVTLFMPFKIYEQIDSEPKLLTFFTENFPDSIPLITKKALIETFFGKKPSALISIKCKPYNYEEKVLLMGDAAHAMVPFYGQGMNCGFEDCTVLEDLLDRHGSLGSVLDKYTELRTDNCHTIVDLAMYNYVEMRDLVNRKSFLLRKKFDNLMYAWFPKLWIPLYTMVTFSRLPYKRCMNDRQWQDELLSKVFKAMLALLFLVVFANFCGAFDDRSTATLNPIFK